MLKPRHPLLRWPWLLIWGPISLIGAIAPLAVLNLLQFPSLLVLPFSRPAYRRYNRLAAYIVWGWWAWSLQHITGVKIRLSGDPLPNEEDAIVFANHQGMSDIIAILCLGLMKGRIADAKWLVKDPVKYVPGVGWGMVFLGCIFLKRDWAADEGTIRRTFRTYVEENLPLWLVSFPEGTRRTPKKLEASRAYAKKAGLPLTTHVMLPRPKGFIASLEGLRGRVQAVYSVTIGYPGHRAPSLPELFRGDIAEITLHVRRFPVETLPTAEAELAGWLQERFYEMDKVLGGAGPVTARDAASRAR